MIRYRFSDFTLSPQRRLLLREGTEIPLIPRYFDLLVLLIERRHEAVHRREIFERVWTDATVSDSALSQAIRTIRRALGDDSREPRFIRTVSRHGYRFVLDVIEEEDDGAQRAPTPSAAIGPVETPVSGAESLLEQQSDVIGWTGASAGAAVAGIVAGGLGGLILAAAPGSAAPLAIAPVLAVIGGACGALGGAGVGVGVAFAETRARSYRAVVMIAAAAIGGGLVGAAVQWLARWGLAALLGLDIQVGGMLEGLAIGAAAGAGYAIATHTAEFRTSPGGRRLRLAIISVLCGLAGIALTLAGRPLVGGTIHAIADGADGSRATLAPLGRLLGEPDFGPVSRTILAFGEGATFGLGLAWGLLGRPRNRPTHRNLT